VGTGKRFFPLKSILMVKKLSETNQRKAGAATGKSANMFVGKMQEITVRSGHFFFQPSRTSVDSSCFGLWLRRSGFARNTAAI
jgi:hypothetical protein